MKQQRDKRFLNKNINVLVSIFFACLLITACNSIPGFREWEQWREGDQTKEADEAIRTRPEYREINDFCNEIQKPDSFVLVLKRMSFSKKDPYLIFGYSSAMTFEDVEDFFLNLEKDGWEVYDRGPSMRSKLIKFKKDKYRSDIEYFDDTDHGNYLIGCQIMDE
jgi:hypothetical protein